MKKILAAFAVVAILGVAVWSVVGEGGEGVAYRFVEIEVGDLEYTVSSTGTLDAITTVQVGTQVSGQVAEIYVDFNDRVTKGELIARIDPTLLRQAVRSAEADLERMQAERDQSKRECDRMTGLFETQVVTESELDAAEYRLAVSEANMKAAQVSLERARQNLAYTEIRAPIDGVVVERNVDVGQTVAASLQAPQLFLIAEDLSLMEILVAVDESDIGLIEEGQTARFTVQAYPDDTFTGTVRQVRLQSTMQENVVNYTVVVDVSNESGKLLPGMTATVDFLVETATDVFKVPNAAVRFRATEEMTAEIQARRAAQGEAGEAPDGSPRGDRTGARERPAQDGSSRALLWFFDQEGKLSVAPVRTGLTDGQSTEVEGPMIEAGMRVIAGVTQATQESSSNPFQSQQQERRPGPPGPPGS